MKFIKLVYLIVSIGVVLILILSIMDNYVSLKYEIYEYRILFDKNNIPTERAEGYLLRVISILKFFLYYVLTTILLIIISLFHKKKG